MIPYNQGCILLADMQNTFGSGSKQERIKLLLLGPNGPALGCTGDSQPIENLFAALKEQWNAFQGDFYSRFKSVYEKFLEDTSNVNRFAPEAINAWFETILLEVQGEKLPVLPLSDLPVES
jgi:hypothetical protein